MRLRVSYFCVVLAAVFAVRFAMMSRKANEQLQAIFATDGTLDAEKMDAAERVRLIKHLEEVQGDLLTFSNQMAEANQRSARITVSFLALGAVMYVFEERKRKRLRQALSDAKVGPEGKN